MGRWTGSISPCILHAVQASAHANTTMRYTGLISLNFVFLYLYYLRKMVFLFDFSSPLHLRIRGPEPTRKTLFLCEFRFKIFSNFCLPKAFQPLISLLECVGFGLLARSVSPKKSCFAIFPESRPKSGGVPVRSAVTSSVWQKLSLSLSAAAHTHGTASGADFRSSLT